MTTIDQLKAGYCCNYVHLETLLKDHFKHISSERYFLEQVKAGKIKIKVSRLDDSKKAPYIVYLRDLAEYLDQREKEASTLA